jgi:acyl dehydratase
MIGLFFEDIHSGLAVSLGQYVFTTQNVVKFARAYDPQYFHLDDEAAKRGPFGKLAASGWHTASAWMKCYVATNDAAREALAANGATLPEAGPSPGFANLKWLKPVFPGDVVEYHTVVTSKRELSSRPRWGLVESLNEGRNQHNELVFSFEGKVLVQKRQ